MNKKICLALCLTLVCSQSHAGIWDSITSFFGGDEPEAVSEPASPEVADPKPSVGKTLLKPESLTKGLALVPLLTKSLGISNDQASGGMGALLQAAQSLMPASDFGKISSAIPGASNLLSLAPVLTGKSDSGSGSALGAIGGALGGAGDGGNALAAGTQLVSQFEQLGMGSDMIPKFTDTASGFLSDNDQGDAASLLSGLKIPGL